MRPTPLSLALCLPVLAQVAPVQPSALKNADFREGAPGQAPAGWHFPKSSLEAGFRYEVAEEAGGRCVLMHRESGQGAFGNLMQALDATPYQGKRVRFRTRVLVETAGTRCQGWMRVDRKGGSTGFFDNMQDRPLTAAEWTDLILVGDVAKDAERLNLGIMLLAEQGRMKVAPCTLEVLGDTPEAHPEGPRPLSAQGLRNAEAFARALAYVQYFHPSDEAAKADWDRLSAEGMRAVEGAPSAPDLARRLQVFFGPYAPTARFLAGAAKAPALAQPRGATQVVRWVHTGVGRKQELYHSDRLYLPLSDLKAKGWPDPRQPLSLDLGGGVRLALPLLVFADATQATLPRSRPLPGKAPVGLPEPTAGAGDAHDRATRLGDVALAWGLLKHFYPYFDVAGTPWDAELPRALGKAAVDKDLTAFAHTLCRMTAPLKDGHVYESGPEEEALACPSLSLCFVDGWPLVKVTGPSAKAIPPGSRLLTVDGEASPERVTRLASEISAATQGWMNARLSQEFLRGAATTPARLTFRAPDGSAGEATLPRDCNAWQLPAGPQPAAVCELRPGIWYVDLDRAGEEDFQKALPSLAAAKGVLFDLRGYPKLSPAFLQHLTDKPIQSALWNVPVVSLPNGAGWTWNESGRWNLEPLAPRITGKVVFLTGGGAISYAESCLGIVEAYRLAEIVGSPSAGTNGNVNPISLPGGFRLTFTGMKVLKHDGSRHHGVGILPTVPVAPTAKGLAEGRDEVLEKGLERLAANGS